jgi:hypothetical protein
LKDLTEFDKITLAQAQVEQIKEFEAEIVETEKWNHDASVDLLTLATTLQKIPYGTYDELFDARPSANETMKARIRKGKQREDDPMRRKRSPYNMLPVETQETWLGRRKQNDGFIYNPFPAIELPENATTTNELLRKAFPKVFGEDVPHQCAYRNVAAELITVLFKNVVNEGMAGSSLSLENRLTVYK